MRHLPWAPGEQLPASPCLLTCLLCSRCAGPPADLPAC